MFLDDLFQEDTTATEGLWKLSPVEQKRYQEIPTLPILDNYK